MAMYSMYVPCSELVYAIMSSRKGCYFGWKFSNKFQKLQKSLDLLICGNLYSTRYGEIYSIYIIEIIMKIFVF